VTDFFLFARHFLNILRHVRGVMVVLLAILIACAALTAWVEDLSFGDALYFTLITGLTVGYGDITPVTAVGRVISVVCGLIGVIYAGIVVAVSVRAVRDIVEEKRAILEKDG
jgi:voltage-gated potassium channel